MELVAVPVGEKQQGFARDLISYGFSRRSRRGGFYLVVVGAVQRDVQHAECVALRQ